jgi:hypothetical protein
VTVSPQSTVGSSSCVGRARKVVSLPHQMRGQPTRPWEVSSTSQWGIRSLAQLRARAHHVVNEDRPYEKKQSQSQLPEA